jgi:hypothetical protein
MMVNSLAIRSILLLFSLFYGLWVHFLVILVYFGMLYQEKSGNLGAMQGLVSVADAGRTFVVSENGTLNI